MKYLRVLLACTLLLAIMLVPATAFAGAKALNSEVAWLSAEYGWTDATNGGLTVSLGSGFFEDGVQVPAQAGVSGNDIEYYADGSYLLTQYMATFEAAALTIDTHNGTVRILGSAPLRIAETYWPKYGAPTRYPERTDGEMTVDLYVEPSSDVERVSGFGSRVLAEVPQRMHASAQKYWTVQVTGTAVTSGGLDLTPRTETGEFASSSGQLGTYRLGTVFLPEQLPTVVE